MINFVKLVLMDVVIKLKRAKKGSPHRRYGDDEIFNLWKLSTLNITTDTFKYNHAERFHIKDGKWFFNDYFDMKINRVAMDNSKLYIRNASPKELKIYKSFICDNNGI